MTEDPSAPAAIPSTTRRRKLMIIAAVVGAVIIVAGIVGGTMIADANAKADSLAAAEADAAAEAAAEAEADEAARAEALDEAETAIADGEARYAESEPWADPAQREKLRASIDALAAMLEKDSATTTELSEATTDIEIAILLVGTKESRDAELAAAAEKALDDQYETISASLGRAAATPDSGRTYCERLRATYTPESVLVTSWNTAAAKSQIDVAAVRVYCAEFGGALDMVLAGFYDGNHVVGTTISAGTYRTVGGVTNCYWERNDGSGDILDNNFITAAHNGVTVTVNDGEGFTTSRCGLWVPAG